MNTRYTFYVTGSKCFIGTGMFNTIDNSIIVNVPARSSRPPRFLCKFTQLGSKDLAPESKRCGFGAKAPHYWVELPLICKNNEYIVFHREQVELDLPENAEKFVEFMKVTNIGLWLDGENGIIVDYMISPEDTDEILAVKFDDKFDIVDIAWES